MMNSFLAFDIGGTKLKYALIDQNGRLLQRHSEATITSSRIAFIARLKQIIASYDAITGIGISVPGKVDQNQVIHFGGSLPFLDGLSFRDELGLSIAVNVENDAKAATLAELWQGSLQDTANGAMLVLGTAIGSGIVLNHQLVYGSHQQAGEISFMSNGHFDKANLMGGQASAVRLIQTIAAHHRFENLNDGAKAFQLINGCDEFASKQFNRFCQEVALAIHNMQTVIDVDRYVIGGGISKQPIVTTGIRRAYDQMRMAHPFVADTLVQPVITTSTFHNDANLYGAVYQLQTMHEVKSNG